MKTKFYFLLFLAVCLSMNIQAQFPSDFKTMLVEEWISNSWRNNSRTTSDYNSSGNLIKQTYQSLDTLTTQWKDELIFEYTNNADGTVKEMTIKEWDEDLNQMVVALKTIFTYTAAKKTATSTTQMDIGMGLMDFMKTTFTYNAGGQLEKEETQVLDFLSMTLKVSEQTLYEYNPDGTEYRSLVQSVDNTPGKWLNISRNTHTYTLAKLVEKTLTEEFSAGAWVNSSQTSFSYNTDATFKEIVEEAWEAGSQKWVFDWKEVFTYSGGKMHQVLEQEWNTALAKWDNSLRFTFGYITTGSADQVAMTTGDLRVYPNPFNDKLHIESQDNGVSLLEIFNQEGKMLYSVLLKGDKTNVDTGELRDGMYILRLRSGDTIRTMKIIKQR